MIRKVDCGVLSVSVINQLQQLAAIFPPQTTPRAVISRAHVTPIANMAASARKRGFSVATVAKSKTRYPFLCASTSCLQFFEAFFPRYSHSTHIDAERIAHQSCLKYLGGISRSVDSSHFVCEAFYYADARTWAPSRIGKFYIRSSATRIANNRQQVLYFLYFPRICL